MAISQKRAVRFSIRGLGLAWWDFDNCIYVVSKHESR